MEAAVVTYKKIEEALNKIPGKVGIKREFPIGIGTRADFVVQTKDGKNILVEVKIGAREGYLSFSTYGQLVMYRKILEEWQNLSEVVPVVITNQSPSHDLAEQLQKAGIAVVMIGDNSADLFHNLKESLQRLNQWPKDGGQ